MQGYFIRRSSLGCGCEWFPPAKELLIRARLEVLSRHSQAAEHRKRGGSCEEVEGFKDGLSSDDGAFLH